MKQATAKQPFLLDAGVRFIWRGFMNSQREGNDQADSIVNIIPTAPRIPPHHPSQREERRCVMSLVG